MWIAKLEFSSSDIQTFYQKSRNYFRNKVLWYALDIHSYVRNTITCCIYEKDYNITRSIYMIARK